ncbi:dihydroflavonol-4-reductase [Youngiibacter multivorans]|uniref:Dihydroflavonol-4-reductase n=1 Tax=Youngiibacter multivorans TaxID=937251 RepID=A0ABS4G525_9CLOT|nr:NAD-dependent epimerase/dehydratase family protein [Youngiibacter multivorans]MBP1919626.1 dihydroflavonol-4-reductase [Youngiibacter multivorans]
MKSKIYLLTGATGNLGSNIIRKLISSGESVRALVMDDDLAVNRIPQETAIFSGNILDIESLDRFFDLPADEDAYVIHCAGMVSLATDYSSIVHDVNVVGTRNVVDQCIRHKVRKLVYISSTSAIPELDGNQKIIEVNSFDPDLIYGYYGKSKALASQIVMDAVREQGLDASIVFPTGIFGPYDYGFGLVTSNIINFAKGRVPGGLTGSFNCADVRDLADGVISCCEKGGRGEGYIMGNKTVTVKELFDTIAECCGMKSVKLIIPGSLAMPLAALSESIGNIIGKKTILTRFTIYNLLRNNNFSSEKAVRELGYSIRPFRDTIRDEVEWLRSEGRI